MLSGDGPPFKVLALSAFNGSLEPRTLGASRSHRALRPRSFSLPRRFAPQRTFRAYFIPVPLSGFRPPRNYPPTSSEYSSFR
jgi:hypothetical protein